MAQSCKQCLNTNLLVILTLLGGAVGLSVGFSLRKWTLTKDTLLWIGILGEMYIRMLKMMIVPLMVSSIITATASLDLKANGKISVVCLVYTMVCNFLPSILGCILCVIIEPGKSVHISKEFTSVPDKSTETQDIFADLLRNVFPDNLIVSTFEQAHTKYRIAERNLSLVKNESSFITIIKEKEKILGSAHGTNIIGLIIASSIFGMATSATKEHGKAFYNFFTSATCVILQMLRWLIWFTPVGVASLLARTLASSADTSDEFKHLGMFIATVLLGFALWSLAVVPLVYFIIYRTNPFRFLFTLVEPVLITFATSSTAIAMPETLHSLEVINKLDKRVTRFVVPLSASIGRSGTCLYINISCLFVVQLVGMELTFTRIVLVCILSTISALANPPVTGASLVNIIIILTALDIPPEAASLLYAFDWLLDRCRSIANLFSHALCVVVTYELSKSALSEESREVTENILNTEITV
ncbi:excitatory amino acid transporter 1-like [Mytilus californianus]|uniref:excitatory amino acid transporter 1-like n=1 Tax=Mytilus californianus TaxID=6549 RepID=UPI002246044B|nr:excitatory amino acid transporter 1-like [Mytilus californianus]